MSCYHPLDAFKSHSLKTPAGKAVVAFKRDEISHKPFEVIQLPCGQCIGCRINRSRQWAVRCCHEAHGFENNCFITLTFRDEDLDPRESLVKADFQNFMKRLRKSHKGMEYVKPEKEGWNPYPIRFFHCGEYGEKFSRPHHHACLFNWTFEDMYHFDTRNDIKLYRSPTLEGLWPFGHSSIGEVNFQSAAYVARYVTKKINGPDGAIHYYRDCDPETGEAYYLVPEYITMSRCPGIGKRWFEKFKGDVFPKDFFTLKGVKFKPPEYYDNIYDLENPKAMAKIKYRRKLAMQANAANNTLKRLNARRVIAEQKTGLLLREYENGYENVLHLRQEN